MKTIRPLAASAVLIVSVACLLHAQQAQPTFEVVSIHPHKTLESGGSLKFMPGGRLQGTNVYVLALIATAFRKDRPLLPVQVEGGPDWIRVDRFDVVAKTNAVVDNEANYYRLLPALLRPVLEERFRLKTHWETRLQQFFALVLARKDGSLGPQVRHATCAPRPETIGLNDTFSRDGQPLCKASTVAAGMIDGVGISMSSLVSALSSGMSRLVVDRTGLEGAYDVTLTWAPDFVRQSNGDVNTPALSTALEEQLGLKLESARGSVDVLVIDHVEKPTAD
jgi:uncharacterized protein (TIGR03435 family)